MRKCIFCFGEGEGEEEGKGEKKIGQSVYSSSIFILSSIVIVLSFECFPFLARQTLLLTSQIDAELSYMVEIRSEDGMKGESCTSLSHEVEHEDSLTLGTGVSQGKVATETVMTSKVLLSPSLSHQPAPLFFI